MVSSRRELVDAYIRDIKNANNERAKKERFITLLSSLFHADNESRIIHQFTTGAEKQLTRIIRDKGPGRGQADTQYGSVIIEFEHDLKRTGEHAKDQLKEYLSGNWNDGLKLGFTLIASDCLTWKVYSPDFESLVRLGSIKAKDVALEEVHTIELTSERDAHKATAQADQLYFFLDRFLFQSEQLPATLEGVRQNFGHGSEAYQTCMRLLHEHYDEIKASSVMRTAYEQWHRFLSVAYGRFQESEAAFLTQSYLSILAKMLAYTVIAEDDFIDDKETREIMNGEAFRRYNVDNFTEDDFFRWTAEENSLYALKDVFRTIAKALGRFDFSNVREDILKGVYQELVDEDTRHGLGEFYTPEWLCDSVVEELGIEPGQKVLDPSCGSGSFLKSVANAMLEKKPDMTARELNDCLHGIDIHPLSVQIAKATVLTALGDKIQREPRPLILHVYLANTLLLPHEDVSLLGTRYRIRVADRQMKVDASIFEDEARYDRLVIDCQSLAASDVPTKKTRERNQFTNSLIERFKTRDPAFLDGGFQMYQALSEAILQGRDSIWVYILQNSYRPFFLREKFDVIVGNPPWLTFSDVENGEYQDDLEKLATSYHVRPNPTNMPHLELAALFLAHACNYFLTRKGKLAFVMPRAFLSGAQHDATRSARAKGVHVTQVWDLREVFPLFNVPACVLFANRQHNQGKPAPKRLQGREFKGRLPGHNLSRAEADTYLEIKTESFHLSKLGDATAWTFGKALNLGGTNAYKSEFKQGATIVPRSCYFVDIDQPYQGSLKDRTVRIRTSKAAQREAKEPWRGIELSGSMPTKFLFRTALSNNILPFALNSTKLVVLPGLIEHNKLKLLRPSQMEKLGELEATKWFGAVEKLWTERKTERAESMTFIDRLNFQNGLAFQNTQSRFVVLYIAAGTNICSAVIDRSKIDDLPFITDHKTYVYFTDDEDHAYYLTAFLNGNTPNELIKPFQSRGLQGERDIHKKILEAPLPRFDAGNPDHRALSATAQQAAAKAEAYVAALNLGSDGGNLPANKLGRLRNEMREHLAQEMAEIDTLLECILMR